MSKRLLILTIIHLAALTACTTQPVITAVDLNTLEQRAAAAAAAGDHRTAATIYRRLADRTEGRVSATHLIEGIRSLAASADLDTAGQWSIEAQALADEDQQQSLIVLNALLELRQARPQSALDALATLRLPIATAAIPEVSAIRGEAYFALGRYAEAVNELVEREIWLEDGDALLANQYAIWNGMRTAIAPMPVAPLEDDIVSGWLALKPLADLSDEPGEFRRALMEWRSRYTNHPAAGGLLADLLRQRRSERAFPREIALLLPLSGEFRSFAIALRDGFLAAYFESQRRRESRIKIYDTSVETAETAYLNAQLDGADFIVGPLLPQDVETVLAQSGFVPTLALNFSRSQPPFLGSFHQFALWPEDEARAVARRAFAEGARTAVALIASDPFGYRLLNSFRAEFESLGGRLLSFEAYNTDSPDHTTQIESLLNINRSEQRHRRLQANLGVTLEFEPRRRQDAEMIFLGVSSAEAGREIMPQLRLNQASDIPTYATQEIFDLALRSANDDLNGVVFADAPLVLEPGRNAARLRRELQTHWPERIEQRIRYYGMGFDAHQLMMSLYTPGGGLWPMRGTSGELVVDNFGRIHRQELSFAQIRGGQVEVLPEPLPDFGNDRLEPLAEPQ